MTKNITKISAHHLGRGTKPDDQLNFGVIELGFSGLVYRISSYENVNCLHFAEAAELSGVKVAGTEKRARVWLKYACDMGGGGGEEKSCHQERY